jgi:hypothetical protein
MSQFATSVAICAFQPLDRHPLQPIDASLVAAHAENRHCLARFPPLR